MIQKLNRGENDSIMIKNSETMIHKKLDEKSEKPKQSEKQKKQKCSKAHPPPPCPEGKEVPEGKDCCYNIKKKPKKDSPTPESKEKTSEETPKKYSYDEQLKILIEYYSKVDMNKTENDIKRILNNRRPKDTPKGTRIPTKPWLELCEKLNQKYNVHPLK